MKVKKSPIKEEKFFHYRKDSNCKTSPTLFISLIVLHANRVGDFGPFRSV